MKTVGIICEYNPFHLGHLRQIRMIREQFGADTAIVCIMSGNYVQRGMPAMWDKFTRANAAVSCGADLVLELPITCVLQSAEGFARGGVELLTRLNIVDILCFGSECTNTDSLVHFAKIIDSDACKSALKDNLSRGLSYAAARQAAVGDTDGILTRPNNILGLEYCRAIFHYGSKLIPLAIKRNGDYHAQHADHAEPSATAVRDLFPDGPWADFMPLEAVQHFAQATRYEFSCGERAIMARLRSLTDAQWEICAHGSEGLWSKAMKASRSEASVTAIMNATKSKRYPQTRIQRLLMCAYLGIRSCDLEAPISYTRLLSASEAGRKLLRKIKNASDLPIINPGQTPTDLDYYRLEITASDLFTLFSTTSDTPCKHEQSFRLKL